ncbi:MAG: N-acetylmuramoyl-L-alanine amidase [Ruminococcaceae bacterium]|nr:N-acetylmuramoyl-L-alanine amidase [Oscillospiraceae bacterium]
MLIFIKKGNLFLLAGILLMSVFGAGLALRRSEKNREAMAIPGVGKRIVLDAGHGEPDGGAEGSGGILEKDLNLSITRYLQGYLEQSGIEVWLTRADDSGIYDENSRTIRQKKRSDLHNRELLMNQSDADLFVSIHMNKFSDGQYSGPQVFYEPKQEASKLLAGCLQESLITVLNPPSIREIKKAGKDIYLLSRAKIPAALVECGFLSNEREGQLLQDETYQKQVAWAIYCGIIQYFAEK